MSRQPVLSSRPAAGRFRLGVFVVVAITVLAFLPAIRGDFIWDDDDYITDNPALRSWKGLSDIWCSPGATPQYYPLVFTTFWIERSIWGLNPTVFHMGNVFLHIVASILAWRVLARVGVPGAFLAALIFAVHPVHVESVAWISERKNVLSAVFYLSSMLMYLRFAGVERRREDAGPARWLAYATSLMLFVASMLSKSTACTLPAAILLLLWWKRDRLLMRDVVPLIPMFIVGIGMGLNTAQLERELVGARGADWSFSPADRVLIAGRAAWFYLSKLLWPTTLIFIYPRWVIDDEAWWQYVYPLAAIALALTLFAARNRIGKGPFVAAAFFGGTLFPALGFINVYPMLFSFVADHFQYLASLGPIAFVAAALATFGRQLGGAANMLGASVIVASLATLTWRQGHMYENRMVLWRTTVERNPDAWIAQSNLSVELIKQGRYADALERARKTLFLRPQFSRAYNNAGQALEGLGQIPEAVTYYNKAIELDPQCTEAHLNLANLLMNVDSNAAERHLRAAVASAPDRADVHHNLGAFLLSVGRPHEALNECRLAVEFNPDDAESHGLLGTVLAILGHHDEARKALTESLRLNPEEHRSRETLLMLPP